MLTNQNAHAQRLYDSLSDHAGEKAADDFIDVLPLSKSADIERKFKWAENVCAYLESHFEESAIRKIRRHCNCDYGITKASEMKAVLRRTNNFKEFAQKYNDLRRGGKIQIDGGKLFYIFPRCYCACVKRIDKPISKTWCYCSLGFVKSLFERAFDSEVDVDLIETIKSGGTQCVFEVTLKSRKIVD